MPLSPYNGNLPISLWIRWPPSLGGDICTYHLRCVQKTDKSCEPFWNLSVCRPFEMKLKLLTFSLVDSMTAKPWRGHLHISFKICTKTWQFLGAILKFKRLHAIWNEVEVTDLFTSFTHDFWKMQSIVQIHLKKRTSFPWWFRFQLPKFNFCGCYLV